MSFFILARIYRHPEDPISLRDVWLISDGELNAAASVALERVQNEGELADLHREVAWLTQALIEFMDLMDVRHSYRGRRQHNNYLYFEAVSALREATVGMLNGLPRASTGLLRSVLEMVLLHCWWRTQISRTGTSDKYYEWLEGRRQKQRPKFKDVVRDNFEFLEIPASREAKQKVEDTYDRLSSYIHTPLLAESATSLNKGNYGYVGADVLLHWFALARNTLQIALEHFVHLYPQSLFPVDITKKFGFNPPTGMYFDNFNFVPLKAVFETTQIQRYRMRAQDHDLVRMALELFESRPTLTREQILETWNDELYNESNGIDKTTADLVELWFRTKVHMRGMMWTLCYAKPLGPNW